MRMSRTLFLLALAVPLQFTAHGAAAQGYPDKAIRLVVPYGPGGSSDIVGRILAQRLSEQLGRNVVPDNRPGAAGLIGTELVARAPADGYTLLIADAGHSSLPLIYPKAGFHPTRDFAPVSLVATTPYLLAVHPSIPARSLRELIALARARPDTLTHASGGTGSLGHLTAELFKQRTGVRIIHVPYKGGGQSVADTVAGQTAIVVVAAAVVGPVVKAGRLRGLAVSSEKRSTVVPDIPTFEESGVRDFRVTNWYAILAPAGTPVQIVAKLNEEIAKAVQTAAVRSRFESVLLEPVMNAPDELRILIDAESARWAKLIRDAGIRTE
jgi:tripartite-type tricarboxylate transporter receptor subunit TctC